MRKITKKSIFIVLFLLIIKIFLGFYLDNKSPSSFNSKDTESYVQAAKQLCETGKFLDKNNNAEVTRVPGMSIILLPAVCLDLNINHYVILLNSLMILLSAYFTFKIVKIMRIEISYVFIFSIYFLDPAITRYQFQILTEIPFLFFITLVLYTFILGFSKNRSYYLFLGFILITISTFVKPLTLYLPYYLMVFFALLYIFRGFFQINFKHQFIIACLLGTLLHFSLTQIWSYRNYLETDHKEFSFIQGVNLYYYITAGIIAKGEKREWINVKNEFIEKTKNFTKKEISNTAKKNFKEAIIKYPIKTIQVGLEGMFMTFFTPGTGQYAKMLNVSKKNYKNINNLFIFYGLLWITLVWLLFFYGVFKIEKNIYFFFLFLVLNYLILTSSGPQSYSRFRIPFNPIIIIFISVAVENFLKKYKKFKKQL
jgi:hypothetical protein